MLKNVLLFFGCLWDQKTGLKKNYQLIKSNPLPVRCSLSVMSQRDRAGMVKLVRPPTVRSL